MMENATDRGIRRRLGRELLLTALSLSLIAVHFVLPPNRGGVRFALEKIRTFPAEWTFYRRVRDPAQRMRANYRMNYDGPIFIGQNTRKGGVLQLPPRRYLSRYYPAGQDGWAEPRFIYYVAGPVRTVPWSGGVGPDATQALVVDTLGASPALRILDLDSPEARDRIARLYGGARSGGNRR